MVNEFIPEEETEEPAIAKLIEVQDFLSVLYGFLETNTFTVYILSGVIAVSQILFMLVRKKELECEESRKILIALILNTFIAVLPLPLYVYSPIIIFYFCATPILIYVKTAGKKFIKTA